MGIPVEAVEIEGFKSIARARLELKALKLLLPLPFAPIKIGRAHV